MSYSAKISSLNPVAIVVMVDQSGSMSEYITWNHTQTTKAAAVSEVINNLLSEFAARSRSENSYRHYYDLMVVGYSGDGVKSLLATEDSFFLTPSQLMGSVKRMQNIQRQRQLPDGRMIMTNIEQRIWIEVTAEGRTPMRAAFSTVHTQLKFWCATHPNSFPPIVINISDGEATDGSHEQLTEMVDKVKSVSTSDGNVLVINIHLSNSSSDSVVFPASKSDLPQDCYAELIFDLSSFMPEPFEREIAAGFEHTTPQSYRGMAYNASMTDLVRLLNIGSTTINHLTTL